MNRSRFGGLFLALTLAAAPAQSATLVHSNDILGDLEPCGCRGNPQGGLSRKFALIEKLSKDPASGQIIQIDAGDMLFASDVIPEPLQKQAELQASYFMKSLDLLKHDIVVPGEKDFALGVDTFRRLTANSKVQFVAANLLNDGKPFLKSHVVIETVSAAGRKLKVGIFGIVGESIRWPKPLKATDVAQAARKEVSELKSQSDLIIAVTHQGLDEDKTLALLVPGIDLIIGGHSQSFLQKPVQVGTTRIYQSSFRNQYVGVIPLSKPMTSNYELVGLDETYNAPAGDSPLNPVEALVQQFKAESAKLPSLTPATDVTPPEAAAAFSTFTRCSECHLKQFDFWRKTSHAVALHRLVEKKETANQQCLRCHSVGLAQKGGWDGAFAKSGARSSGEMDALLKTIHDAPTLKQALRPKTTTGHNELLKMAAVYPSVQCESCHGAGGDHPFGGTLPTRVSNEICLSCHTAERSPLWYTKGKLDEAKFAEKRRLIACPAGELPPELTN